jgi:branched-subunit amino acid transport protein
MTVALAILLTGLGTYLSRALFIVALARRRFPPLALRALEYVAPAVMGALIVTLLTSPEGEVMIGWPEFIGLASAAIVVRLTRNHVWTLLAALGSFWLTSWLL